MLASAQAVANAGQGSALGFLCGAGVTLINERERLYVALCCARELANAGYNTPEPSTTVRVVGTEGIAVLEAKLSEQMEAGMISTYDFAVGRALAVALCGGRSWQHGR